MTLQPKITPGHGRDPKNPYQGRWRWWYPGVADWIIRHPEGSMQDCARDLNKAYSTISFIVRTDMFQEYLAQRRQAWQKDHDFSIISKVTRVAEKSLDLLLDKMEKQADKIPMQLITEVATSSLDRLGYGSKPQGPSVNVNVNNGGQQVVMMPISAAALEEARDAIREAEKKKALESNTLDLLPGAASSRLKDQSALDDTALDLSEDESLSGL